MAPPISRTVKVPVYQTQQNWTPRQRPLSWRVRSPLASLIYYLDLTDVLADEGGASITGASVIPYGTDEALTITEVAYSGSMVSFLPTGGTSGFTYLLSIQVSLSTGSEIDVILVTLPVFGYTSDFGTSFSGDFG